MTVSKKIRFRSIGGGAGMLCVLAIVACGGTGGSSAIAEALQKLKPLAANCDGPVAADAEIDGSLTGRGDPSLIEDRFQAVEHLADQVVACGGVMRVALFGRSQSEEATLGEAELPTSSGTETARLIAGDKVEGDLLEEIRSSLPAALKEVHPAGTDVLSTLELAQEFARQHPSGRLYLQLDTDGLNTVGPLVMNTAAFTPAAAHAAAEKVILPDLSGAHVEILGLGKTSGDRRPSTAKVRALTTFYELACRSRTKAASCFASSAYAATEG